MVETARRHEVRGRSRSLSELAATSSPLVMGRERTLPLHEELVPFLAEGALVRGTTVRVEGTGAASLALALASAPSAAGSWVAVVGNDGLGLAAAAEVGLSLSRLVMVSEPPARAWGQVLATLAESVDVVLAWPRSRFSPKVADRLATRLRTHGAVLVVVGSSGCGLGADVVLRAGGASWEMAPGSSHLRSRCLTVEASGRGRASAPRRGGLWLPGPGGAPVAEGRIHGAVNPPVGMAGVDLDGSGLHAVV